MPVDTERWWEDAPLFEASTGPGPPVSISTAIAPASAPPAIEEPDGRPDESPSPSQPIEAEIPAAMPEPPKGVRVRVLGPLRIEGVSAPFRLRKAEELVFFLALVGRRVEADAAMEALWPGEAPNNPRLTRAVSTARRVLRGVLDGDPGIPRVSRGTYWITELIRTDVSDLREQLAAAEAADDPLVAMAALRLGLGLVEGAPFSGITDGYEWIHDGGFVTEAIRVVDKAAHRLAGFGLDAGDTAAVVWASRRGLLAASACEECYRNLMRAAIADHDHPGLEAVFSELTRVLADDDDELGVGLVDDETLELYERHSRGNRRTDT